MYTSNIIYLSNYKALLFLLLCYKIIFIFTRKVISNRSIVLIIWFYFNDLKKFNWSKIGSQRSILIYVLLSWYNYYYARKKPDTLNIMIIVSEVNPTNIFRVWRIWKLHSSIINILLLHTTQNSIINLFWNWGWFNPSCIYFCERYLYIISYSTCRLDTIFWLKSLLITGVYFGPQVSSILILNNCLLSLFILFFKSVFICLCSCILSWAPLSNYSNQIYMLLIIYR